MTSRNESVTFEAFDAVDLDEWKAKVEATTPLAKLSSRVDVTGADAHVTAPLYEAAQRQVSVRTAAAPWAVAQEYRVARPDAVAAAVATDRTFDLEAAWVRLAAPLRARAGVAGDGVVLDEREHATAVVEAVGDGVLWVDAGANGVTALSRILEAGREPSTLRGGVLCDPLGALVEYGGLGVDPQEALTQVGRVVARAQLEAPQLRTVLASGLPYHDAGASASIEVGAALATLIDVVRTVGDTGVGLNALWSSTVLRVAADCDVFVGLAKIRALRWLAERVAAQWGVDAPAFIAARSSWRDRTRHDPWVNMLRATAEVFGAATAGADEIAVQPFSEARGHGNDDARRWALTTAHMLRDESHVANVVDPAAGSGYVESLTSAIAERAWAWVQGVERQGGMRAALQAGAVQADVRGCAEAQAAQLATGRLALTGVSVFPQFDEPDVPLHDEAPSDASLPSEPPSHTVEGLRAARLAVPFEALRHAADRQLQTSGHRPRAQLYTLGSLREHRARLDFARSLVMVGGFAVEVVTTTDDIVPALAVLVASDDRLASEGAAAIEALRAAGAPAVWVASAPRDDLKPDGFLHRGSNVPQTMTALHDALGVGR
ncbi:MAG: methylmalonyl-CoA mutase family protein [Myxococcota bacterium]